MKVKATINGEVMNGKTMDSKTQIQDPTSELLVF
jgi:hypothetical protein